METSLTASETENALVVTFIQTEPFPNSSIFFQKKFDLILSARLYRKEVREETNSVTNLIAV